MKHHLRRLVALASAATVTATVFGAVAPAANASTIAQPGGGGTSVTLTNITLAPVGQLPYYLLSQAGNLEITGTGGAPNAQEVRTGLAAAAPGCAGGGGGALVNTTGAVPAVAGTYHARVANGGGSSCVDFEVRTTATTTTTVQGIVAPVLTISAAASPLILNNGGPGNNFVPNLGLVNVNYSNSLGLTLTSTADQAYLTAQDNSSGPGTPTRGFLLNPNPSAPAPGYKLASALQINSSYVGPQPITGTIPPLGTSMNVDPPIQIASIDDPVTNQSVTVGFNQAMTPNEPIRTGTYSMGVLFTLSTASP